MKQRFFSEMLLLSTILLCLFATAIYLVLPAQTTLFYGFRTPVSLIQMLEQFILITPMIAGLCSLFLSHHKDRLIALTFSGFCKQHRFLGGLPGALLSIFLINALFALAFLVISFFLLAFKTSNLSVLFSTEAWYFWWVSFIDLTLVGVFIYTIHALFRRTWATVLLFLTYAAIVIWFGSQFGITRYIGFGTTPNVINTLFNSTPLHHSAAMEFRQYWLSLVLLFIAILSAVKKAIYIAPARQTGTHSDADVPASPAVSKRSAILASCGFALLFILVGTQFIWPAATQQQTTKISTFDSEPQGAEMERARLTNVDIQLNLVSPDNLTVQGSFDLQFSPSPRYQTIILRKPDLLRLTDIRLAGGPPLPLDNNEFITVELPEQLRNTGKLSIDYEAISAADSTTQQVLDKATFLFSRNVMPQVTAPCRLLKPEQQSIACDAKENYLNADIIKGRLTISHAKSLQIIAPGKVIEVVDNELLKTTTYQLQQQLSEFYIVAGEFHVAKAKLDNTDMALFTVTSLTTEQESRFTAVLSDILTGYAKQLDVSLPGRFRVVQLPRHLGEAFSFGDTVFLSENILSPALLGQSTDNNLLRFVLAHEVAHNWFGYQYVPANTPGKGLLLESSSQLLAYHYLHSRELMPLKAAMQQESALYCKSLARNMPDRPLAEITDEQHLSYHKGALALIFLQHYSNGQFLSAFHSAAKQSMERYGQLEMTQTLSFLENLVEPAHFTKAKQMLMETDVLSIIKKHDSTLLHASCE